MLELVEKARLFATAAHTAIGQTRKYTGEPYVVHPAEVVKILECVPHTPEMLAAGWLHDVAEDTLICLKMIENEFGKEVYSLVFWMTDVVVGAKNRAERKAFSRGRWEQSSAEARTIKLADIISNTKTIAQRDPKFAKVYFEEISLLLPILADGGNATLHRLAQTQVKAFSEDV